jgi:hypothetical protein
MSFGAVQVKPKSLISFTDLVAINKATALFPNGPFHQSNSFKDTPPSSKTSCCA